MFADFFNYDELENMARMVYRQRFGGWRESSDPFMNEEDAIQAMVIHVWRRHTAYDPTASSKKTWVNMLLKYYVGSIYKHAVKEKRFTVNRCSLDGIDVAENRRVLQASPNPERFRLKGSARKSVASAMMKMRKQGATLTMIANRFRTTRWQVSALLTEKRRA